MCAQSAHPILPSPQCLTLEGLSVRGGVVVLAARTVSPDAACPECAHLSERVHSRYTRTLLDLPWQGNEVRIELTVRRFFCENRLCPRRIFAERLPPVAQRYARKTARLADALRELAYLAGGEAAACIARTFGLVVSADALLACLRKARAVSLDTPRVLGVDDFAFRKGRVYGTILIDLERRRPIDLLPDRAAGSLAAWLRTHPGVEIVSRDRSSAYADAVRAGAPDALQVADRWHLLHNLGTALEELLTRHRTHLYARSTPAAAAGASSFACPPRPCAHEAQRGERRTARVARYERVVCLWQEGKSVAQIAAAVGVSPRTVNRFLAAGAFPERGRRRRSPSALDSYLPYLKERWEAGCRKGMPLWREIVARGYAGPVHSIYPVLTRLSEGMPLLPHDPPAATGPPKRTRYSVRETAWLLLRPPGELKEGERHDLEQILGACPQIAAAHELSQEFRRIVSERDVQSLAHWLEAASASAVIEFRRLSAGLRKDRAAVEAGLSLCWSNGQTEGQVNRLKLIKRQMYGRAGFHLLRARVLHQAA